MYVITWKKGGNQYYLPPRMWDPVTDPSKAREFANLTEAFDSIDDDRIPVDVDMIWVLPPEDVADPINNQK